MRIGLALEAGGVKGVAHIALLEKLESIDIEIVTGSSMGAVIGALFALSGDSKTVKKKFFSTLKKYLPVFRDKIRNTVVQPVSKISCEGGRNIPIFQRSF